MENKFLCLMAGYDDDTENHLAGIQNKLYDFDRPERKVRSEF